MLEGKGAMVWQLRNWQGGDAQAQAQQAKNLGLAWVSIKIIDGRSETWENPRFVPLARQNVSLLPATVAALRGAGITVAGWGYTYGGVYRATIFFPSKTIAQQEGAATVVALARHEIVEYQIDAEKEYRKGFNRADRAEAYCLSLMEDSRFEHSLCSYRFPKTRATDFPTHAFAPYMEAWSPQVYWVLDNRLNGGAAQLEVCAAEHQRVRPLPMTPIGPTYADRGWRARPGQLKLFFEKARSLDRCVGVGVWCLEQASPDQLVA